MISKKRREVSFHVNKLTTHSSTMTLLTQHALLCKLNSSDSPMSHSCVRFHPQVVTFKIFSHLRNIKTLPVRCVNEILQMLIFKFVSQ